MAFIDGISRTINISMRATSCLQTAALAVALVNSAPQLIPLYCVAGGLLVSEKLLNTFFKQTDYSVSKGILGLAGIAGTCSSSSKFAAFAAGAIISPIPYRWLAGTEDDGKPYSFYHLNKTVMNPMKNYKDCAMALFVPLVLYSFSFLSSNPIYRGGIQLVAYSACMSSPIVVNAGANILKNLSPTINNFFSTRSQNDAGIQL